MSSWEDHGNGCLLAGLASSLSLAGIAVGSPVMAALGLVAFLPVRFGRIPGESGKKSPSEPKAVAPRVTVRVASGSSSRPRDSIPNGTWYGQGRVIAVGPYDLVTPLVYVGKGASYGDDPSLIDPTLKVGRPESTPKGSLGYWPRYSGLTPNQRANYLHWLETGRGEDLDEIGYAFLYFYGLERRAILEGRDLQLCAAEVLRLLEHFGDSRSFLGYGTSFLAQTLSTIGLSKVAPPLRKGFLRWAFHPGAGEGPLKVGLAYLARSKTPLSADQAKALAAQDSRTSRSVVLKRLPEHFDGLFRTRYREEYPNGLILSATKKKHRFQRRPASQLLLDTWGHGGGGTAPLTVADVLAGTRQFKGLVRIWQGCLEDLRKASRLVGKGETESSAKVYQSLPKELQVDTDHPKKALWAALVDEDIVRSGRSLAVVGKLAELCEFKRRKTLTKKQSHGLAEAAASVGYGIEPDPRQAGRNLTWSETVAVFPDTGENELPFDERYDVASAIAALGVCVAAADGVVDPEEIRVLRSSLSDQLLLPKEYLERLDHLIEVLSTSPPHGARVRAQTKRLTDLPSEKIAQILVDIAKADGEVHDEEHKLLKRYFDWFDLDEQSLVDLLGNIDDDEAVVVQLEEASEDDDETLPSEGSEYIAAETVLELAATVAASDGSISSSELELISGFIVSEFGLGTPDRDRLTDYTRNRSRLRPSEKELSARLDNLLHGDLRVRVARFLGELSALDRKPEDDSSALARAFDLLGVDEETARQLQDEFASESATTPTPRLDENRIQSILEDSRRSTQLLSDWMDREDDLDDPDEDVDDEESAEPPPPPVEADRGTEGPSETLSLYRPEDLQPRFHPLLEKVCTRDNWPEEELHELAKDLGLMPGGAIEAINEWSEEAFEDVLLEEVDGEYHVNRELIGG